MASPFSTQPILDQSVVAGIRALSNPGEPDLFAEVVSLFLGSAPDGIAALRTAVHAMDLHAIGQSAHRLRGGALEIGAVRMAVVCAEIEQAANTGALPNGVERWDALRCEFALVRAELEQAIQ